MKRSNVTETAAIQKKDQKIETEKGGEGKERKKRKERGSEIAGEETIGEEVGHHEVRPVILQSSVLRTTAAQ